MSVSQSSGASVADRREVLVSGRVLRTARPRSELYIQLGDVSSLIEGLKTSRRRIDIVTFVQDVNDPTPRYSFYYEPEKLAVLSVTTYEAWFKTQLYNKPRNTLRKALKSGVEVRVERFSESLVRGIKSIYDESPVRQGRVNRHYKKGLATIEREHATFLERSEFIAAYCSGEMIGFAKLTFCHGFCSVMNFLSKIGHRDKAPNNAILAKAVEICADRNVARLVYGAWGKGGARGLAEFKLSNGFQCVEVPRYYVPLTMLGTVALKTGIHAGVVRRMPERYVAAASNMRERWNTWRFKGQPV